MKKLLPLFTGPSRYLGTEPGSVHKDPAKVEGRLALAFPDMYEVGMSYLGQKILYGIVNSRDNLWAERVFAPDREVGDILRRHNEPLCTLESDTPLSKMDAVAFHITHELCYTNILYMLDLGGIPLMAVGRDENDPIVMAGGGCVFNAEPVAPFFDLMILGDGEEVLPEVMELIAQGRKAGTPRGEIVKELRHVPGVYVPSLFASRGRGKAPEPLLADYTRVEKRIVVDMESCEFPTNHIVPFASAVHNRLAVEIARGCTRGCRFCQAGMIYRPARERSPETLDRLIAQGLEQTGYEDLSFLSLSTGDYSALEELFTQSFERCRSEQVAISLPSLRVGSVSERIMGLMASIRRTGATLAPEAGSQRLRDVINKGITEQALVEHVKKLFDRGWQQVKLYFMIGLPTETPEDIEAILDLCLKVRDCAGKYDKRLQVTAAVSPFVPKSHTPFQWERQIDMDEVRQRVGYLKDLFRPHKRLQLRSHLPEMSFLEGFFSRGDRSLAPVVLRAYDKGALFTSWKDHMRLAPWLEAMEAEGLDPMDFLAARDEDGPLPWDHLSCGVTKKFLLTELHRSRAVKLTDDCRYLACRNCGVCNLDGRESELASQAQGVEIRPRVVCSQRDQDDASGGAAHQTEALAQEGLDSADEVVQPVPPAADRSVAAKDESGGPECATTAEAPGISGDALPTEASPTETAPGTAPAAPELVPQDAGQQRAKGGRPLPPDIGELSDKACHYRIWHAKLEETRFLSPIELQSLIGHLLRRAKIPVSFSAGFHPLPRVSFGRALPVGVASEREWFDVYLRRELGPQELAERLMPHMPEGFQLLMVETLPISKKFTHSVAEDYLLEFHEDFDIVAARRGEWEAVLELESMPWTRMTKKGERTTDIRALIAQAEPEGMKAMALRFNWTDKYLSPLRIVELVNPDLSPERYMLTKMRQWMHLP
ncbi:MAG: TIGR03960 family B12-binding radical SAM protein [Proteobacteria bacterium]|nr:TIGR03960 family B12-binding radical SAM protein [Pseudomonadota bacterium]